MIENHLLINEIQLGNKLNECVHSNRRSDFSLMLAMLTDDAREFSEFAVPDGADTTLDEDKHNELALRRLFNLPEKAPLALNDVAELDNFNEAHLITSTHLPTMHFNNALKPKPLSFRDNVNHIEHDIVQNTSLHTQRRYESNNDTAASKKLNFNAVEWLNVVQQSITKAPITENREAYSVNALA